MPQAADEWPPREWDRADLLAVALVQNPAVAVANAQTRAALAHEITAGESPNPDLTLQSEYARHDPYPWLYGVALNWLLRSPERRRLETKIAQLDTKNARLELMDEAWTVRRELTAALSDWESARRRSNLLDHLATAQERFVKLERQRIEAGEDAPGDLLGSEHALIEIEQQRAELRAAAEAAQAAAAKALGVPMQALDGIVISWPNWGEPPLVDEDKLREMREQALLSRTDLGMAISDYSAAEAKLQLAVARQYPQYELSPGFYWDHGIAKFPFDVSFSLPFNRNRGEIAEARAGRDIAGQRMLALQADIYGEVASAERAERVARASMNAAERQLATARRQQQQADLGLRLGATDSLEPLGAQIIATRVELEVLQMRAQLQASRNVLEDALHAPLSGPELTLSISGSSLAPGAGS
jgi:outer membrane protein TolC